MPALFNASQLRPDQPLGAFYAPLTDFKLEAAVSF
jgi:hypothetical protein